eukprot:scaffold224949_cov33-Prasinocladus_malaysianus.AAC.1
MALSIDMSHTHSPPMCVRQIIYWKKSLPIASACVLSQTAVAHRPVPSRADMSYAGGFGPQCHRHDVNRHNITSMSQHGTAFARAFPDKFYSRSCYKRLDVILSRTPRTASYEYARRTSNQQNS